MCEATDIYSKKTDSIQIVNKNVIVYPIKIADQDDVQQTLM